MRIGIDARFISYTGIGRLIYHLVTKVPALDHGNDYVIFLRPEDMPDFNFTQTNVRKVQTISTYYDVAEQTTHWRIIQNQKLDLLHVPHFNVPLLYRGKLVVTIHDLIQAKLPSRNTVPARIKRQVYKQIIRSALGKANQVLCVSNFTRQDIIDTFGTAPGKIQVIQNGVETKWVTAQNSPQNPAQTLTRYHLKAPFLLYVGLSSLHKNLARLIAAVAKVNQTNPIQLAIVGKKDPRYTPALASKIAQLGMQSQIILTDFVPDQDLKLLYQLAKAFIFPSLYEGFGLPPLEALSLGLPVLSSNTTALPEVLGGNAIYFDPHDANDMAAKINGFLDGSIPSPVIKPHTFSWDKMAQKTLEVYKQILNSKS